MHADRSSATAWNVALLIDVALCVYLAASVCLDTPWPPPGPRAADVLARPGETVCDAAYLDRQRKGANALAEEIRMLLDNHEQAGSKQRRQAISLQLEDATQRQEHVYLAQLRCADLQAAVRVRRKFEADVGSKVWADHRKRSQGGYR